VTIFIGLNTLFQHLMTHRLFKQVAWSQLRLTVSGGMATHPEVAARWFQKTGSKILEGYGLTECSPVVSINPLGTLQFNNSIGQPVIGTRVMLRLETGELTEAPDQAGELCVLGPQVMRGYWQDDAASAAAFFTAADGERWFLTGDIARFDKRGFIYLIDRKKDLIIVSGFNVYPNEVEAYLTTHPEIEEAAVIGVPAAETGEAVKAFIVPKKPGIDTEAVRHFCRSGLAAYKVPSEIVCSQVLPKTAIGKVLRRALRD
jgi:long-chain acyl-CoA synthetase